MSNQLATTQNAMQAESNTTPAQAYYVPDKDDFVGQLHSRTMSYTSMVANTDAEKKALFNIINSDCPRLSSMIGKTINAKHVYIETVEISKKDQNGVEFVDPEGEPILTKQPRILIIDDKGVAYQCVSKGILGSLKKIFQFFGEPTVWEKPIKLEVKQIDKGNKRVLTLLAV